MMNSIDFTPLYRSSVGYDRLASLINSALAAETSTNSYPPYNIEMFEQNRYAITLAVAGFAREDLDIQLENGVLTVRGSKSAKTEHKYLHQGIANRSFERKFNLADYVDVTGADLADGLLTIQLVKEIPEAMKPRTVAINTSGNVLEHNRTLETTGDKAA